MRVVRRAGDRGIASQGPLARLHGSDPARRALERDGQNGADPVDMALHQVTVEPARGGHRPLQVDGVARLDAAARIRVLEAAGLQVDQFVNWRGGADALMRADEIARDRPLPRDLEIVAVDGDSLASEMAKLDA